jgi:hypothetical protein
MALRPPALPLLSGASRAHANPRHPRLFENLPRQTPRPTLPPPKRGRLKLLSSLKIGPLGGGDEPQFLGGFLDRGERLAGESWSLSWWG